MNLQASIDESFLLNLIDIQREDIIIRRFGLDTLNRIRNKREELETDNINGYGFKIPH